MSRREKSNSREKKAPVKNIRQNSKSKSKNDSKISVEKPTLDKIDSEFIFKDELRFKIVLVGDGGVGKTSIVRRYTKDQFFDEYDPTISVDFDVKKFEEPFFLVKINLWDVSGHPEFWQERLDYYKDSDAVIFVYDCSLRQSYQNLQSWYDEVSNNTPPKTHYFVCENKIDQESDRVVSSIEGEQWSESIKAKHFKISAKEGVIDADIMFRDISKQIVYSKANQVDNN